MRSSPLLVELCADLLDSGHHVRFAVPGHSMHPTIHDRDVITVAPVKLSEIERGDILLYRSPSGPIAHRVVSVPSEDVFLLRGDASVARDKPVRPEQILGLVVSVERGRRRVNLNSRSARIWQALRVRASRLRRALQPPDKNRMLRPRIYRFASVPPPLERVGRLTKLGKRS